MILRKGHNKIALVMMVHKVSVASVEEVASTSISKIYSVVISFPHFLAEEALHAHLGEVEEMTF